MRESAAIFTFLLYSNGNVQDMSHAWKTIDGLSDAQSGKWETERDQGEDQKEGGGMNPTMAGSYMVKKSKGQTEVEGSGGRLLSAV